jgi:hypothetical protein
MWYTAHGAEPNAACCASPSPRQYSPRYLAEKIFTSHSALEGERKQVTVLFTDLQEAKALFKEVL